MTELTHEEFLEAIAPKSDQLNADDLLTGPITVTILAVRRGDSKQRAYIDIDGYEGRPFKPCKTVLRALGEVWNDEVHPKRWVGRSMTLYRDPDVKFQGIKVGGIRVSHVSHITEPRTFMLTETRGKRIEVTIRPIATSPETQAEIDEALREIAECSTSEELKAVGFVIAKQPQAVQNATRGAYKARKQHIETGEPNGND